MSTQGGQGPDLSRIVSLIMQNPDLIRQIESLANQNSEQKSNTNDNLSVGESSREESKEKAASLPASVVAPIGSKREKRTQLLSALRPYVSEKRGKTIDTLLGAMDLWDLVSGG